LKFNRDLINGFVSYSVLKFGQKIIALAQMDQQSDFPLTDSILVVGGGNGEYILELDGDLEIGQKNLAHSRSLIGGGGINQTLRLLKAGYSPLPILPLTISPGFMVDKFLEHLLGNIQFHLLL
jgi:hypothetical protein